MSTMFIFILLIVACAAGVIIWIRRSVRQTRASDLPTIPELQPLSDNEVSQVISQLEDIPIEQLNAELEGENARKADLEAKLKVMQELSVARKRNEAIAAEVAGAPTLKEEVPVSGASRPKILVPGQFPPGSRVVITRKGHKPAKYG